MRIPTTRRNGQIAWTSQIPTDRACEKIVVRKVYRVVPFTPTEASTAVVVASSVGITAYNN